MKEDECYFAKELYPGTKTILAHDINTLNTSDTKEKDLIIKTCGNFSELYPAAWTHDFDGGHAWCTVLGHDKRDYADPCLYNIYFKAFGLWPAASRN